MRYFYLAATVMLPCSLFAGEAIPGATFEQWLADPEAAAKAAGAVADKLESFGAGTLATIAAVLGFIAIKAAPIIRKAIPIYGPMISAGIDALWKLCATKDQRAKDKASELSHAALSQIGPIIAAIRQLPPGTLPDHAQQLLNIPIIKAALDHIEAEGKQDR